MTKKNYRNMKRKKDAPPKLKLPSDLAATIARWEQEARMETLVGIARRLASRKGA